MENKNFTSYLKSDELVNIKDRSYEKNKNNPIYIKYLQENDLEISKDNFNNFEINYDEHFEYLKLITDDNLSHNNELCHDSHSKLNRYSDILPYKSNFIRINIVNYINASIISTPTTNSFIATQGPKENTTDDFWQMIYENNCVLIIMLCGLKENGRSKCHQYWPDSKGKTNNFRIENISEKLITDNLIERNFKISNILNKEDFRVIKQLHFVGWPDHGVPKIDEVYSSFKKMIEEVDNSRSSKSPVVVHCSAGIGRTGTFMAIYNVHHTLKGQLDQKCNVLKFNIWNTVRIIKEQRLKSVENLLQYKFIFAFAKKYLKEIFI